MNELGMSSKRRAVALLVVQAVLVLSIAGKYLYERKVCPRVWVRAAQYDPSQPLRGRYLALQLAVDACELPMDEAHRTGPSVGSEPRDNGFYRWTVRPEVVNGKLVPKPANDTDRPEVTDEVTVLAGRSCDRAVLSRGVEYFIADTAKGRFPLSKGQQLWVEVTVPPVGPPRPIQLAMSEDGVFSSLKLR